MIFMESIPPNLPRYVVQLKFGPDKFHKSVDLNRV